MVMMGHASFCSCLTWVYRKIVENFDIESLCTKMCTFVLFLAKKPVFGHLYTSRFAGQSGSDMCEVSFWSWHPGQQNDIWHMFEFSCLDNILCTFMQIKGTYECPCVKRPALRGCAKWQWWVRCSILQLGIWAAQKCGTQNWTYKYLEVICTFNLFLRDFRYPVMVTFAEAQRLSSARQCGQTFADMCAAAACTKCVRSFGQKMRLGVAIFR
jgi:hypothetical protein